MPASPLEATISQLKVAAHAYSTDLGYTIVAVNRLTRTVSVDLLADKLDQPIIDRINDECADAFDRVVRALQGATDDVLSAISRESARLEAVLNGGQTKTASAPASVVSPAAAQARAPTIRLTGFLMLVSPVLQMVPLTPLVIGGAVVAARVGQNLWQAAAATAPRKASQVAGGQPIGAITTDRNGLPSSSQKTPSRFAAFTSNFATAMVRDILTVTTDLSAGLLVAKLVGGPFAPVIASLVAQMAGSYVWPKVEQKVTERSNRVGNMAWHNVSNALNNLSSALNNVSSALNNSSTYNVSKAFSRASTWVDGLHDFLEGTDDE